MLKWLRRKVIENQVDYLKEMRPLPLGRTEFNEWSKEIYRLAGIPGLTFESAQFALADMVLHVKPTQSFESYGHFVHSLRKGAANQVAHAIFVELKEAQQRRALESQPKEVQPVAGQGDAKVLAITKVQDTSN